MQNPQDRYNFLSQRAAVSGCERCLRPRFPLSQGTLCVEIVKMHPFKKEKKLLTIVTIVVSQD